ncbi:hypothetical protein [Spirosoma montaniterrae]|uniref:Uncharacterized protein n=1 Tax=Spirosoma montaniterrae TaxID=1178516 RepID=A0A1P9WSG7_9BACT|nr:hypothetical protein [Spirosoma montaniterrae]AQG78312.1 hypothetical protein AWR27_02530 [Spirosoma montaniterrae]
MLLTGPNGALALTILDYECSDSPYFMDRNWLIVSLKIRYQNRECVRTAPVLSTWEIELLLKWMRSLDAGHELSPKLSFIEPALSFSNISNKPNDYRLRVKLGPDVQPSWQHGSAPFFLLVEPDKRELQQAVQDLEKQIKRFPVRE